MRRASCFTLALTLLLGCAESDVRPILGPGAPTRPSAQVPANAVACPVIRISDGDTLVCSGEIRIRLILVDTPEMSQDPFGTQAKNVLSALAPVGSTVFLEYDLDRDDAYGRTLAYVWRADGQLVNERLLLQGVAVVAVYPPNIKYETRFRAAMQTAQAAGAGFWSTGGFNCLPADHRAGRC